MADIWRYLFNRTAQLPPNRCSTPQICAQQFSVLLSMAAARLGGLQHFGAVWEDLEISLDMPVVVFFDLGNTLVVPKLSQAGALQELTPLPLVSDVLKKLKGLARTARKSIRLGVISDTGSETREGMHRLLTNAKLLGQFDPALLLFSSVENLDKTKKAFFQLAAKRAGVPAQQCIYVGEDKAEREVATKTGFRTSYHPLHALHVAGQMMQGE